MSDGRGYREEQRDKAENGDPTAGAQAAARQPSKTASGRGAARQGGDSPAISSAERVSSTAFRTTNQDRAGEMPCPSAGAAALRIADGSRARRRAVQLERELARGESQEFDMIAVDAFSSDVIPVHLLTAECGDVYRRRLAPGGLQLVHISNRSMNLERVARGLAEHLGWKAVLFFSGQKDETGESTWRWVIITSNTGFLQQHRIADAGVGCSCACVPTSHFPRGCA